MAGHIAVRMAVLGEIAAGIGAGIAGIIVGAGARSWKSSFASSTSATPSSITSITSIAIASGGASGNATVTASRPCCAALSSSTARIWPAPAPERAPIGAGSASSMRSGRPCPAAMPGPSLREIFYQDSDVQRLDGPARGVSGQCERFLDGALQSVDRGERLPDRPRQIVSGSVQGGFQLPTQPGQRGAQLVGGLRGEGSFPFHERSEPAGGVVDRRAHRVDLGNAGRLGCSG